jgi:hypothetical protein
MRVDATIRTVAMPLLTKAEERNHPFRQPLPRHAPGRACIALVTLHPDPP